MGKELLFEIGTEEIPSVYMPGLLAALKEKAEAAFKEARLGYKGLSTLGTPRRLVLHVEDLAERQEPLSQEILGPPVSAAFDKDGKPTKAALGFAKTNGVEVSALRRKQTEKGERLMFYKEEKGLPSDEMLKIILTLFIVRLPSPKSMRIGESKATFVRPVRWTLALYGESAITFRPLPAGIGTTPFPGSGSTTRAHRFMASDATFQVKDFKEYLKVLRENFVEPDPERRKQIIREDLQAEAGRVGGQPAASPGAVERLVEKVAFLVEWPFPVACRFEERFLDLPEEVIISTLEVNQRCFALRGKDGGRLLPDFVGFSNTKARDMSVVRKGYERVVRARLEDAEFYWKLDLKTSLDEMAQRLRGVVYHPRLGTSFEKAERFRLLAGWLRERLFPERGRDFTVQVGEAARLAKADLTSGMVGEFPELQGKMGEYYAIRAKVDPEVAKAIFEHYLPRGEGDALPAGHIGALVGMADRMDTLAGMIGLGYLPSGSEDPYALRRGANAILQIAMAKGYRLSLPEFAAQALEPLYAKFKDKQGDVLARLSDFLRDRLKAVLSREGARGDLVEAVLSASEGKGWHDPVDARARLKALERLAASAETFEPLTTTFKRVSNIVRQARAEGKAGEAGLGPVEPGLLAEPSEKGLAEAAGKAVREVEGLLAPHRSARRSEVSSVEAAYASATARVAGLRPAVDRFFDDVLVMAEDAAVRRNRLALMAQVAGLFSPVADFAKIQARPTS
ncbi:MAG: glycine--tRNA ligase subunit beta [Candidatus Tectomicrobia bacterium]|uniref:Glycine--tRNA ligase beta subunit n=1 Tax=Tectimicrobiota bacterium TaxID=2528274 RepID=A0A932I3K7_UNCTE|nr:glycine--tRNA ligase subunit beta [Candidatus Tectomicrobia bacterium]